MGWDKELDVVIVGSGNGAMTAGICLHAMGVTDIALVEKSDLYGGSSSLSGGGVWVPNNRYAKEAGAQDNFEEAYQYLKATIPDELGVPDEMIRTYLQRAPEMVDFLHENSRVRYESLAHYPDYFSDAPGSRTGHRSMEPAPVDITELEGRGAKLRRTHSMMYMLGNIPITQKDAHSLVGGLPGWRMLGFRLVMEYLLDLPQRLRSMRSRKGTCGSGGVARLALSLQDRNIPIWLNSEMRELIVEDGRAVGIVMLQGGKTLRVRARKGVILASGGFEHNQAMREKYLPAPTNKDWSAGHTGNTGLPLQQAMDHGAAVRGMDQAWWCTTYRVPGKEHPFLSIMEKSMPGNCVVNRQGKRIANESMNYQMYVQECLKAKRNGVPVDELWMVFDARFRANYIIGPLMTSKLMPDAMLPKEFFCPEFLTKAKTLEELSEKTGIEVAGLKQTIDAMNRYAQEGKDDEFNRGGFAYDRYYGDPSVTPNPCLAPIAEAPFYAIRIYLGEFGTNGGLVTNPNAQVIREDGSVFDGLYATGNVSAAILPTYAGPGSTLGPAMTFAYQAARSIAEGDSAAASKAAAETALA